MEDISLYALLTEILTELGTTSETLARISLIYKILYQSSALVLGVLSIVNTVFAFVDINSTVKQVFLAVNLLVASGLLGNFGGRAATASAMKSNVDIVTKNLTVTLAAWGPQPHSSMDIPRIIDHQYVIGPPPPPISRRIVIPNSLSNLVGDSVLQLRLLQLETMLSAP